MRLQITVPPNTPAGKPVSATGSFEASDTIHSVTIQIPTGHAYLTGIQVKRGDRGLIIVPAPGSNTDWIIDDGRTIAFPLDIKLEPIRKEVIVYAYNIDDTYPHTFYVDVE